MVKGGITGHEKPYEGATNVWLTPKWVIDKFGPFDLDPCAADPRPFDIATKNYSYTGLSSEWEGFVFCNPPYGPHVGKWIDKMIEHDNGLLLIFARTETRAMQKALKACSGVLFLNKRILFLLGDPPHEEGQSAGAPSMLVAYGMEAQERLYDNKELGVLMEVC